ncbi:MAG: SurA N-terminal domain-containing protein [Deltaproteobacteria bacterium]|nr:SurA N-terminal domain-containing protein [Deltaproteobacteria bacterium]
MLSLMRKHAASWFIKAILGVIVLVFVFWGVGSFRGREGKAASVNGQIISRAQWARATKNLEKAYQEYFKDRMDPALMDSLNIPRMALDQLVEQALLAQKAKEMGFSVSDSELSASIASSPLFRTETGFDIRLYRRYLANARWTEGEYEDYLRDALLAQKVRSFVNTGVQVPESEAKTFYDWLHKKVAITAVAFEPAQYKEVSATEEEAAAWFEDHAEDYRTEAQVRVDYVLIPFDQYKDAGQVTDEEARAYYDNNPGEFSEEKTVEASHILIRLRPDAGEEQVKEARIKAQKLAERARKGEDFAKLARENSQGPTASRGGYLGAFGKNQMLPAFSEAAFSMEPGQISDPVRTDYGWHVILVHNVNPAKVRTFEEAKADIKARLASESARTKAYDRIIEVFDASLGADTLADAAQMVGANVHSTGYFGSAGPKELAGGQKVASMALEREVGDYSDIIELPEGYILFQVKEIKPSAIPEHATVADEVQKDADYEKRRQKAGEEAEAFLARLKQGEADITALAKKEGRKAVETGFFERAGHMGELGYLPQVSMAAFQASASRPYPSEPVEDGGAFYVFSFKGEQRPDPAAFDGEKQKIADRLLEKKKEQVFDGWVQALRKQADIRVSKELFPKA